VQENQQELSKNLLLSQQGGVEFDNKNKLEERRLLGRCVDKAGVSRAFGGS